MKIRIKGNSIRYRLTKAEVEIFSKEGYCAEKTVFNTGVLTYALRAVEGIDNLTANFEHQTITMCLPMSDCQSWATNNRIGFEHKMVLEDGQILALLLEKDFYD